MIKYLRNNKCFLPFCMTLLFILSLSQIAYAQIKAVTDTGEEVILYDDGTWEFKSIDFSGTNDQITVNPKEFTKSDESTFQIKSKNTNTSLWLNPKKWSFSRSQDNPDGEYEFRLKGGDLYGVLITERLEMPLATLKNAALENARAAASEVEVLKQEYRNVNGTEVLMLKMSGNPQGINIVYFGYYFSNSSGSTQLITYTSKSLMDEYEDEVETFLNGFMVLEKDVND